MCEQTTYSIDIQEVWVFMAQEVVWLCFDKESLVQPPLQIFHSSCYILIDSLQFYECAKFPSFSLFFITLIFGTQKCQSHDDMI